MNQLFREAFGEEVKKINKYHGDFKGFMNKISESVTEQGKKFNEIDTNVKDVYIDT